MKKFSVGIIVLAMLLSFVGIFSAAAENVNTKAIVGTWYGNMNFPDNSVQRIMVDIKNCTPGNACGFVYNYVVRCTWELTFDGMQNNTYVFHHSRTLSGQCPAQGIGYYTPLPDGSLRRVQINPTFITAGILNLRPNASQ